MNDYLKILNEITGESLSNKEELSHYSLPNKYSKSLLKEFMKDLKTDVPKKRSFYERFLLCFVNFLKLFGFVFNSNTNSERRELLLHEDEDN